MDNNNKTNPVQQLSEHYERLNTIELEKFNKEEKLWYKKQEDKTQKTVKCKLIAISLVCTFFIIVEVVGGALANSIAILSDAAHLSSDLFGFIFSIYAVYLSGTAANKEHTYGYHRAEILGALTNIMIIIV